jgi:hypothetical protein
MRNFDYPYDTPNDGRLYDPISSTVMAGTKIVKSVYDVYKSNKEAKKALGEETRKVQAAQDEQARITEIERQRQQKSLREQQSRLIRRNKGNTSLLFGAETGVNENLKQTLGG